jgi:hypothetical protein
LTFKKIRLKEKSAGEKIHFWRTKDKAEIDFILETPGTLAFRNKIYSFKRSKTDKRLAKFS